VQWRLSVPPDRGPQYLLKRLTSFARVIVFDKRGQGLSDRVGEQTVEERIGDVRAVMDAAGSPRATIFGWSEGGSMSLMFSATYPERTSALVLCGSFARIEAEPWSVDQERWEEFLRQIEIRWAEGVLVPINAPSRRDDTAFVEWFARLERTSASPGAILALMRANYGIDVRHPATGGSSRSRRHRVALLLVASLHPTATWRWVVALRGNIVERTVTLACDSVRSYQPNRERAA
jgi:pimeloyl-ACP methyl ester carboxylesterase